MLMQMLMTMPMQMSRNPRYWVHALTKIDVNLKLDYSGINNISNKDVVPSVYFDTYCSLSFNECQVSGLGLRYPEQQGLQWEWAGPEI